MFDYRKATVNDLEIVTETRIEFMATSRKPEPGIIEKLRPALHEYLKTALDDGSFIAWLAFDGDDIAATSGLSFFQMPPSTTSLNGKAAYISNMYTKPQYRGKGIASKLFSLTVEEAKMLGYKKIKLTTTEMGRPIYEKFGFKPENGMIYLVD